jgi:hypothetical protein
MSADSYSAWDREKTTLFSGHYLRNRSTLDIGVLGYMGILYHKEHPPEVWHILPGHPVYIFRVNFLKCLLLFRAQIFLYVIANLRTE